MPNPLDIIGGGLFGGNMDDSFMKGMQMAISMENMKLQRQQAQERIDLQKLNAEYMRDLTRERTNALQSAIAEKNRMATERSERTNLLKPVISKDYGNIPAYEPPGLEPGQYAQPLISETPSGTMKGLISLYGADLAPMQAQRFIEDKPLLTLPKKETITPLSDIGKLQHDKDKLLAVGLPATHPTIVAIDNEMVKKSTTIPPKGFETMEEAIREAQRVHKLTPGSTGLIATAEMGPQGKWVPKLVPHKEEKPEKPENPLKAANEELTVKNKIEGVIGKQLSQEFGRDVYDPILQTFTWDVKGVDRERVKARYNELKQTLYKQYGLPLEPTMTPKPVMDAMPDAKIHKGRTIADTATGKRYRSNGIKWMEIK